MKNGGWIGMVMLLMVAMVCAALPQNVAAAALAGEQAFMKNCAVCHPNGGNIINPEDTLGKKVMATKGIRTFADIIGKMRNPGPGMTQFDAKTIPDNEAKAIAEYILKTFK